MYRWVISLLCQHHRVHLHKPRWYSPLHTWAVWCSLMLLGYKPVQHVTLNINTADHCNTMVSVCVAKHIYERYSENAIYKI